MITVLSPALPLKALIKESLDGDADLAAFVGIRIYAAKPPNVTVRPFIRIDMPTGASQWLDGGDGGSDLTGLVSCHVGATATYPDPEATAARINAHVVRILSSVDALLDGELAVSIIPTIDQVLRDPDEADVWNGIVRYRASAT